MHTFCSFYIKTNLVYVLVHRNILMYNIYLHSIYYVDMHLKTIIAVCLVYSMKCTKSALLTNAGKSYLHKIKVTPPPLHMRKIPLVLNEHHFC